MSGIILPNDPNRGLVPVADDYLPFFCLMTSSSKEVKAMKFPMNHFAKRNGDDLEDLGHTLDVILLSWRSLAMDFSGQKTYRSYNPDSDLYKKIVARADSGINNPQCAYGPEFLCWIQQFDMFATFHLGSKTGRKSVGKFAAFLPRPNEKGEVETWKGGSLTNRIVDTGEFVYATIDIKECSTVEITEGFKNGVEGAFKKFLTVKDVAPAEAAPQQSDRG